MALIPGLVTFGECGRISGLPCALSAGSVDLGTICLTLPSSQQPGPVTHQIGNLPSPA